MARKKTKTTTVKASAAQTLATTEKKTYISLTNLKKVINTIYQAIESLILLNQYREAFPSETLLEMASRWFKDTDDVAFADCLQSAEVMDVDTESINGFRPVRIRFRVSRDYFLCQLGTRMQYTSACSGTGMARTTIDIVVPISLSGSTQTLTEKYYFEKGGGQLVELYFVPGDGETLSELSIIEIRYDKGLSMQCTFLDTYVYKDGEQEAYVGAEALSGNQITDASGNIIGYKLCMVDLKTFEDTTITEKGTYTLTIPEGTFLLGDEKIPNEEETLTYHIE